jgi:hypothetical protein
MYDEMTINDAINVANVLSDVLASDANDDVQELAIAARRLARQIGEQSRELERERARRQPSGQGYARVTDGHPLEEGTDGGGRRDFLTGRPVHAGQTLYILTCTGWQGVRYESNMPGKEPVLYLRLPGVRQDVVIAVPREARFAWPDELQQT